LQGLENFLREAGPILVVLGAAAAALRADEPQREFEIGEHIRAPGIEIPLLDENIRRIRPRLLELGYEELEPAASGRITFRLRQAVEGGRQRFYLIHYDPNDAGGPNWHKYVVDVHGQYYELNDRARVEAFGTQNAIGRVHIRARR
jgi:hypothetical protein